MNNGNGYFNDDPRWQLEPVIMDDEDSIRSQVREVSKSNMREIAVAFFLALVVALIVVIYYLTN